MKIKIHRMRKAEQGFTHILLMLLALAGLAGLTGFAVWRISSYNDSHGKNASGTAETDGSGKNTATASAECIAMTHDENICHLGAIDGLDKHASIVKITMKGADGASQNFTEKFDGKGNNSVESDAVNGITVGGHNYVQIDDKWIDSGGTSTQSGAPSAPALATTAGVKYENLGKVDCGKDTCYKYRCTGGILGSSVVLVTFGTKDYLPRHYDIATPEGGASLLGNMTMDITYQAVAITAPAGAITMEQYQQQLSN